MLDLCVVLDLDDELEPGSHSSSWSSWWSLLPSTAERACCLFKKNKENEPHQTIEKRLYYDKTKAKNEVILLFVGKYLQTIKNYTKSY